MKEKTIFASLHLPDEGLVFDLNALYACLQTIPDHRHRRGVRYRLASLLMIGVLANLAGQDSTRGMAHWAKLRVEELSQFFHLRRERMPHYSTWSRVLGYGVEPREVEEIVGQFFAQITRSTGSKRGSIHLAIDGKTLRGTIPLGETEGVHRLSIYQPLQGGVLAQMNVEHKGREITFAPTLLGQMELRGAVVSSIEKGHGRLDKRSIIVSSLLADYQDWPGLAQVFKLERQSTNALGQRETQVRYGVTSLPEYLADPKRLLQLSRGHWGIENGLHYRRDVTLREDHAQLRMGHAPEMLAVLNNIVLGLFARQGQTNIAHARRDFASHLDKALVRLLT